MTGRVLVDERDRTRIREDLDSNLLVEAGAGSGKTTNLVARMLALVARGVPVEQVAAVTFTRKAAGELRERFEELLEHEARARAGSEAGTVLARALAERDRAFIGTIHAFAGRLLREHPLEAGLDPSFEEVDEEAWPALLQQFWVRWLERLRVARDPILDELHRLGIDPRGLAGAFDTVSSYPDVSFPAPEAPVPDATVCRRRLAELLRQARALRPADEPEGGWDRLQRTVRRLDFLERTRDWSHLPTFAEILGSLSATGCQVTQNRWPDRHAARDLGGEWADFLRGEADHFLTAWREHCYPTVMRFLLRSAAEFADARVGAGRLGFEDLLVRAAELLERSPRARRALGERFRHLLVDEFQDTDPIQARICLLLASDPDEGSDWLSVTPRPGALFVVGDPKQSIYRFRRADIQTYEQVKRRFETFGAVLRLVSNFRSVDPIGTLVDARFATVFPADGTPMQAPFAPLATECPPVGPDGVYRYQVRPDANTRDGILADDAERVASEIAARLSGDQYRPSDFLVLTYNRHALASFAEALSARNIPVTVTGAPMAQERELAELLVILRAIADPTNPVLVTAALEGMCFGASVAELGRAREDGTRFVVSELPAGDGPACNALRTLHEWWKASRRLAPDLLVDRILDETGLLPHAAGQSLGDSRAGALLHLVAVLRDAALQEGLSITGAITLLESLLEHASVETPLRPGRAEAVRVMNLHKAKGLEARVVFLAAPVPVTEHPPRVHVSRGADGSAIGGLQACNGDLILAQPPDWARMAADETAFLNAERERLLYVATTRAARELIVAQLEFMNRNGPAADRGFWAPLSHMLERHAKPLELPLTARAGRPRLGDVAGSLNAAVAGARARLTAAKVPRQATRSVTGFMRSERIATVREERAEVRERDPGAPVGAGAAWGRMVHAALEGMGRGRTGASLERYVRAVVLAERGEVGPDELDDTVRRVMTLLGEIAGSEEWQSVVGADAALFELPMMRCEMVDDVPTITEGVADVVLQRGDAVRVLDWKTDQADAPAWAERAGEYAMQVARYAEIIGRQAGVEATGSIVRVGKR